jgi:hypothetical protein
MDVNVSTTHSARPRQNRDTNVAVVPSSSSYLAQMEACHQLAYGYTPQQVSSEDLTAEKFRQHLTIFPEGQFIAVDRRTDRVVGLTVSMRVNLRKHAATTWAELTNDG